MYAPVDLQVFFSRAYTFQISRSAPGKMLKYLKYWFKRKRAKNCEECNACLNGGVNTMEVRERRIVEHCVEHYVLGEKTFR